MAISKQYYQLVSKLDNSYSFLELTNEGGISDLHHFHQFIRQVERGMRGVKFAPRTAESVRVFYPNDLYALGWIEHPH